MNVKFTCRVLARWDLLGESPSPTLTLIHAGMFGGYRRQCILAWIRVWDSDSPSKSQRTALHLNFTFTNLYKLKMRQCIWLFLFFFSPKDFRAGSFGPTCCAKSAGKYSLLKVIDVKLYSSLQQAHKLGQRKKKKKKKGGEPFSRRMQGQMARPFADDLKGANCMQCTTIDSISV